MRKTIALLGLYAALAGPAAATWLVPREALAEEQKGTWEFLDEEDGIKVWRLEVPGKDLPGFRGETVIQASIEQIIEVMMDNEKHTDWMYRCEESTVLKELSPKRAIIYTRVSAPWPVWDRDAVLESSVSYNEDKTHVRMEFHTIKGSEKYRPVPERVVRMPRLVGFYTLDQIGPEKTRIRYEAESDIGGSIPRWLANMAAKDLPFITLSSLRDRVMEVKASKQK